MSSTLTTIANVKSLLNITSSDYDTLLTDIVDGTNQAIANYCNRDFDSADHIDVLDATDHNIIFPQYPVNKIYYAGISQKHSIKITYTGSSTASVQVDNDKITLYDGLSGTEYDYATFDTVSKIVTEMDTQANFDVEKEADGLCETLWEVSKSLEADEIVYLTKTYDDVAMIKIYEGYYSTSSSLPHRVIYNAGYDTIPADLALMATKIASAVYQQRSTAGQLKSESLGDYSYSIGSEKDATTIISTTFNEQLEKYKNKTI